MNEGGEEKGPRGAKARTYLRSKEQQADPCRVTIQRISKRNGRTLSSPPVVVCLTRSVQYGTKCLFGGHFFLFAFHPHLFEFAFLGFDRSGDFLLDLGRGFFELG